MADVVEKIVRSGSSVWENNISRNEILDLAYIIPDVASYINIDCERSIIVPDVRIIKAFVNLIEGICNKYILNIKVANSANMDNISSSVLEYLNKSDIENLFIQLI
ncbi:hypothetical protein SDC9_170146 [bioreactor metagenome]|uniref:Uncharacterized protein n=1 Tax=bioreactor metagenome TaxID=1076179 RepID=A0A645G9V9_9ZZZZ